MELYQAYTDYKRNDGPHREHVPSYRRADLRIHNDPYADVEIDLGKPFERLTMIDAIRNIPVLISTRSRQLRKQKKLADEKGVHYEDRHVRGDIINLFFEGIR